MNGFDQIIENIYSAALDPEAWPVAMRSLQRRFDGVSTGLYSADTVAGTVSLVHLRGIAPDYVDSYVDRYLRDNPWSAVPELQRPGRVRTDKSLDRHYGRPGYYRGTDFFNEWMKPQNFVYTLGVNLIAERNLQTKLYLYRSERSGPFSRADVAQFGRLARHLTKAVAIARRFASESSRHVALDVIDRLKFGVVLVDEDGRVVQMNRFAEALVAARDGLAVEQRHLTTMHRGDMPPLAATLRSALDLEGDGAAEPCTAKVRRRDGRRPLSVTAFPLPRREPHPFGQPRIAAAVILTDPELDPVLPEDELRRRYSLTPAEARLAQNLARGAALRDAASSAGLTYETARWYLKSTFQKTGTARQADLVRLLLADQLLVG